jgi:hypothetical protein
MKTYCLKLSLAYCSLLNNMGLYIYIYIYFFFLLNDNILTKRNDLEGEEDRK